MTNAVAMEQALPCCLVDGICSRDFDARPENRRHQQAYTCHKLIFDISRFRNALHCLHLSKVSREEPHTNSTPCSHRRTRPRAFANSGKKGGSSVGVV